MTFTDCSCASIFSRLERGRDPNPLVLSLQSVNCVLSPFACFVMTFSTFNTFEVQFLNKTKTEKQ